MSMANSWRTRLIHPEAGAPAGFQSLAFPTYRGSTTLFSETAQIHQEWRQDVAPYGYGLYGTPTTLELAARIADLEGARHTFIVPGGQAAIALVDLALLSSGDHLLVPESIYGPNRDLADGLLKRFGVIAEYYDPLIGAGIADLIRDTTRLIWCESPGSVTMEVQDVPAIAAAAPRAWGGGGGGQHLRGRRALRCLCARRGYLHPGADQVRRWAQRSAAGLHQPSGR
jgi:cystathionine beta-lyase